MRATFTSGSVGRAPGNRCLYPEADRLQRPLRSGFQRRLTPGVRWLQSTGPCRIVRHFGKKKQEQRSDWGQKSLTDKRVLWPNDPVRLGS
jgi:hypothetical protein